MNSDPTLELLLPIGLETRTGGFIYDRRIVGQLREHGCRVNVHELRGAFPLPAADELNEAEALLRGIRSGSTVVIDGLALGGMPEIVEHERARLRLTALIHHPLALETGLDPATAQRLRAAERRALAAVSRIVVTSRTTACALADFGVAAGRITVVSPGTDRSPLASGSGTPPLQLLCVATLTPRKGHAVLIEALAGLRDRPWRLACVGSVEQHPATAAALRRQIARFGLEDRVELLGELDNDGIDEAYARADAFVLASHYEGYGMALAEALARGLPIVTTRGGAIEETVPETAGLLVRPGDCEALRDALRRLIDNAPLRARLHAGACEARRALPTWQEAGARFAEAVFLRVAH